MSIFQKGNIGISLKRSATLKCIPYLMNVLLALFIAIFLYILEFIGIPYKSSTGFYCKDPSLTHKFKGDTVSVIPLYSMVFLVPFVVTIILELSRKSSVKVFYKIFFQYKDFLIGFAMVLFITDILKMFINEPRPQFFDLCEPEENQNCTIGTFIENFHCTSKKYQGYMSESATKSFPSGHASLSVFMAMYSSHMVQTRLVTKWTGNLLKTVLIACCQTLAIFISTSRISDRRHHWWDVLAGVIIGILGYLYVFFVTRKCDNKPKNYSCNTEENH